MMLLLLRERGGGGDLGDHRQLLLLLGRLPRSALLLLDGFNGTFVTTKVALYIKRMDKAPRDAIGRAIEKTSLLLLM